MKLLILVSTDNFTIIATYYFLYQKEMLQKASPVFFYYTHLNNRNEILMAMSISCIDRQVNVK